MKNILVKIKKSLYFINFKYRKFGKFSIVNKPLLVTGKKCIEIGQRVFVRDNARIEAIMSWNHEKLEPNIFIGDNCVIEQDAHIISTTDLIIEKNTLISSRFFVTTCNHSYSDIKMPIFSQKLISKPVKIGESCFIGMDVKVFPGVTIGKNCIIGANSIVMCDIPEYSVAVGVPAIVIKKYDFEKQEWVKIGGE